jgi:NADH:ubiquinone oxidoreductase subunit E
MGTACYVRGAADIVKAMEHQLSIKVGETTKDLKYSLEVVRCLGACGLAPVIFIDEDVYGSLKPRQVGTIFENY